MAKGDAVQGGKGFCVVFVECTTTGVVHFFISFSFSKKSSFVPHERVRLLDIRKEDPAEIRRCCTAGTAAPCRTSSQDSSTTGFCVLRKLRSAGTHTHIVQRLGVRFTCPSECAGERGRLFPAVLVTAVPRHHFEPSQCPSWKISSHVNPQSFSLATNLLQVFLFYC